MARRGEPGKDKSKTDNRCSVCCSNSQDSTGAVVLLRWKDADEVFAQVGSLVKCHQTAGVTVEVTVVSLKYQGYRSYEMWNGTAGS